MTTPTENLTLPELPQTWSSAEVADRLGVSRRTIERASQQGLLPFTPIHTWSGTVVVRRYTKEDVEAYLSLITTPRKSRKRKTPKPQGK